MATLFREDRSLLIPNLKVAKTALQRMRGLLGSTELADSEALWLLPGNGIHTFFMKYQIDCVFLDRELRIRKVVSDIRPWKIVWPVFGAYSMIELKSGVANKLGLNKGDRLYVGS